MEINSEVTPQNFNGYGQFDHYFFKRFPRKMSEFTIGKNLHKNYLFPTYYNRVSCAMGLFPCGLENVEDKLSGTGLCPIRITRKKSLVLVAGYQYREVAGLNPYNEIVIAVPVKKGKRPSPFDLLKSNNRDLGHYVLSMPVTSLENKIRGTEIWGIPKVLNKINISNLGNEVELFDCQKSVFKMKIPFNGKVKNFDESAQLFTIKNGTSLVSRTHFQGKFYLNNYFGVFWGGQKRSFLEVSSGLLLELDVGEVPLQTRYCDNMRSVFNLPNQI